VTYPGGEMRRITNDLLDYDQFSISITANNRSMVTVQQQATSSIWVVPDLDASRARQLIARANSADGLNGLAWTPDGRIIYTSRVTGQINLWGTDREGNNPRQLTSSAGSDTLPCVSPDGRYVVFASNRSGRRDLWRADIDGSNEKPLTTGARVSTPTFSSDGRWVIYSKVEDGVARQTDLWRVSIDGGSAEKLTDVKFAAYPTVSPDDKWIAFYKFDTQDRKTKAVIVPFDGGAPVKTLVYTFDPMPWLRWSPDGRSLIYNVTNKGATNLWRLPIDGGAPQQITDFKSEQIWYFDFARDGKQLAVARGTLTTDVVLINSSEQY
jgi:Tol biopolymer transport system component